MVSGLGKFFRILAVSGNREQFVLLIPFRFKSKFTAKYSLDVATSASLKKREFAMINRGRCLEAGQKMVDDRVK